ncbi:hypothetical protein Hanom_Chr08g00717061 [Helianthus anomalus]
MYIKNTFIAYVLLFTYNHWVSAQWPPARILIRRWRVRVLLVPNAPTVADLPPDSGLLGGGLRGGITSAVGRTVEYPPLLLFTYADLYIYSICYIVYVCWFLYI